MGLFGGSKSSSTTETNIIDSRSATSGENSPIARDQAIQTITNTTKVYNTTTDHGAVEAASRIAEKALVSNSDVVRDALDANADVIKDALNFGGGVLDLAGSQQDELAQSFKDSLTAVTEAQKGESERTLTKMVYVAGIVAGLFALRGVFKIGA